MVAALIVIGLLAGMTEEELDFLTERKRAYQLAFSSPAGEAVMRDMVRYCRAKSTTGGDTLLEGRRQVYLRIQQHLELEEAQLYKLYVDIGDF